MRKNRSMPDSTIIPVLGYPDVRQALGRLADAFGFAERLRIGGHRAQLAHTGGAIVVTQAEPAGSGQPAHSVMVRVADVDAHYMHAIGRGVVVSGPPVAHPYGERQYSAVDPGGQVWTFSQIVQDVDPAIRGGELHE